MIDNKPVKIDIEAVISQKNPKLLKILPKFIINYIKNVLHQNEINEVLEIYKDYYGLDFVRQVLDHFNIKIKINCESNIPKEGKFIFAANHPFGGIESVAMMRMLGRHFEGIRFLVNDVLLNLKNYDPLFVPVNKYGAQARNAAKIIQETYLSDNQVLIFPAGLVSRKIKGKITDLDWHKSFITKAKQYKRDIVPIFIHGQNSKFFYRLSSIRRFLRIKANIEMFYLADEMFKKVNSTIEYTIGKPISYKTFDKRYAPSKWAELVKQFVYTIKYDCNTNFEDFIKNYTKN